MTTRGDTRRRKPLWGIYVWWPLTWWHKMGSKLKAEGKHY
jgi:hypothetical protein